MDKYDVGIVGVWQGCNYGSMMTYYALNRAVQSMGKSVLMIDKPLNREGKTDIEHTDTHYVWPAKSNRCLTISSISYSTGQYTDYTNYGSSVDFAAPGGENNRRIYGIGKGNNTYEGEYGTSMAAPYYTAVIADLKANGRAFGTLSNLIKSLNKFIIRF